MSRKNASRHRALSAPIGVRARVGLGKNGVQPCCSATLWPALMPAYIAASYVGERSSQCFRRRVGKFYPQPTFMEGRGEVWRKADLDMFVDQLSGRDAQLDAADIL